MPYGRGMLVRTEIKEVEIGNAVAEAVFLVFGGIPQAAKALGIVPQGVRNTLTEGRVSTRANAERWEQATEAAGCKVPKEELIGWATWKGTERHGDGDRKRPKGSSPRGRSAASSPLRAVEASTTASLRTARVVRPAKEKRVSAPPPGTACSAFSIAA